jgi:hypothetical protein
MEKGANEDRSLNRLWKVPRCGRPKSGLPQRSENEKTVFRTSHSRDDVTKTGERPA